DPRKSQSRRTANVTVLVLEKLRQGRCGTLGFFTNAAQGQGSGPPHADLFILEGLRERRHSTLGLGTDSPQRLRSALPYGCVAILESLSQGLDRRRLCILVLDRQAGAGRLTREEYVDSLHDDNEEEQGADKDKTGDSQKIPDWFRLHRDLSGMHHLFGFDHSV